MSNGVVRTIVRERGFGFIGCGSKDVFFHHSQLQGTDFRFLREGQSVLYRIGLGQKGLEAVDIRPSF
jgi:CspA family cold shock protein